MMTFGEKIKKLRADNNLNQEELADKLLVTRTAVSKWETGKGYPSIDSMKQISNLFNVRIDDLISDEDVKSKKLLDEKQAKRFYFITMAFLSLTILSAIATFFGIPYVSFLSLIGVIGYVACAFYTKPRYKRIEAKKYIVTYIVSRVVVLIIVIITMVYTIMTI